MSARARPVQVDGQPAPRAPPRTQEQVQGAHCECVLFLCVIADFLAFLTLTFVHDLGRRPVFTTRETQSGKSVE